MGSGFRRLRVKGVKGLGGFRVLAGDAPSFVLVRTVLNLGIVGSILSFRV